MTTAWVFPGQGSQAIGMDQDLITQPVGQVRFEEAAAILGWSVVDRCQGDLETLSRTLYTQPCLYTVEAILVDALKAKGQQPDFVAGHSLGEYVALYTAGVFDFATGLKLVKRRAELMDQSSGGMMAALLGFNEEQLQTAIEATPDVIIANDNCPGQVVISGTPAAVETVLGQVKTRKAVPLKVSGAFHSAFMASAAQEYQLLLDIVNFAPAQIPVISNVEPEAETDPEVLKERLVRQMTGPVRWRETGLALEQLGVDRVVEVGPGNVLTGLIKRIISGVSLETIGSLEGVG
jgi:[acyl-carrier-protein] S-malonyltransferase